MKDNYIWWKEVVLGPFTDEEIKNINYKNLEIFVDQGIIAGLPKTGPLNEDMKNNPNVPHIFYKNE